MLKVIIVDDDDNVVECLNTFIKWENLGFKLTGRASNGMEALKLVSEEMPDVIITDLKMPVMDGATLCQKIFELADDVTVIFLSAYEDFSTAKLAMKYNVTEYILKPINKQKINQLINVLSELSKNYKQRGIFNELISDRSKHKEIVNHLIHGEKEWFAELFTLLGDCTAEKFMMVRDVCCMLIDTLYEYLEQIGISQLLILQKKEKSRLELESLHMKMDMITYVSQMYSNVMQFLGNRAGDSNYLIIQQVQRYIQKECSNPMLGVAEIAEKFHFSPDYISKLFNKYMGTAINPYITEQRIHNAAQLLRETNLPATNIAEMVGYSNLNYFVRVFKKQMKMTPTEYRSMILNANSNVGKL